MLYEHYFYISHSKKLKEKVFLRFFWFSELVQATWKTTTLYLVYQSCCILFATVKHWRCEKAQVFPGSGAWHSPESRNSWIPSSSPCSPRGLLQALLSLCLNYTYLFQTTFFFLYTTFQKYNLKYLNFRWIYWRITSLTRQEVTCFSQKQLPVQIINWVFYWFTHTRYG